MKVNTVTKALLLLVFFMQKPLADEILNKCDFLTSDLFFDEQTLKLSFNNKSARAIYIPGWYLGEVNGEITHDMFIVRNFFGFPVRYKGFAYKRKMPSIEEMIKIDPNSTFTSAVNLRKGYLNKGGTYTVIYSSNIGYYFFDDKESTSFCFEKITSNKVKIKIK